MAVAIAWSCNVELVPRPRPPSPPSRTSHLGLDIGMTTLPSGLRVVTVRDPRATEVQVTMRYQVGASGTDHILGGALRRDLMFQQDLACQPLFTHLEDTATYFNAATTYDATTYVSRGPRTALDTLLEIEAIRIEDRCKTVSDGAFARERQVVIAELDQRDQATEIFRALHALFRTATRIARRSAATPIPSDRSPAMTPAHSWTPITRRTTRYSSYLDLCKRKKWRPRLRRSAAV